MSAIEKFSCDPIFSLIIFYCILYMDTNNGLRQMVAASIVIMAYPLLMDRKVWKYIDSLGLALNRIKCQTALPI